MEPFLKRIRPESAYPSDISTGKEDGRLKVKGKNFPSNTGGRSFLAAWQDKYDWLEYSTLKDSTFCFYCRHFGAPKVGKGSPFFSDPNGFSNWKKAIQRFDEHSASDYHQTSAKAFLQWQLMKEKGQSVATLINTQNQDVIKQNRHYLRSILICILFCCKQGLALRVHGETLSNVADGDNPGNFLELTRLLSRFDDVVKQRLSDGPGNARYTHHSIQNDLIACAAKLVRQSVASEVAACGAFSLICDEARDIAHTERLSLCVRYVYDAQIKEEFLASVRCEKLDAANLTEEIFRTLGEVGIHPSLMVSQCYDGASVISGAVSGVAQRVRERANEARSAIYIHCFAHRVNLVVVEVCRAERFSGLFQVCQDLHRFLASSIVNPVFKKSQKGSNPAKQPRMVPSLSETRWVCQFRALDTMVETMPAIFETLEVFEEEGGDRGGTAQGLRLRLNAEFMVNLVTMRWVLNVTADVAESLQDKEHTLAQGLADIDAALTRLHRPSPTEDDEVWNLLWDEANRLILDLGLPVLAPTWGPQGLGGEHGPISIRPG